MLRISIRINDKFIYDIEAINITDNYENGKYGEGIQAYAVKIWDFSRTPRSPLSRFVQHQFGDLKGLTKKLIGELP